jgi:ankyrin repeat protein
MMLIDANPKSVQTMTGFLAFRRTQPHELIKKIVEVFPKACEGNALHYILQSGDGNDTIKNLRLVVNTFPGGVKNIDYRGKTPLHLAVETLSVHVDEAVSILTEVDCDSHAVRQHDKSGNLPIHGACESKRPNTEVIMLLADLHPEGLKEADKDGNLPLVSDMRGMKFCFPSKSSRKVKLKAPKTKPTNSTLLWKQATRSRPRSLQR